MNMILLLLVAVQPAGPAIAEQAPLVATEAASPSTEPSTQLATRPGYTEVGRLPSPHATQAALADSERLYAISNTTIATYDRASGDPLALATAEGTQHLNSGFLHEGKIYCAHSNYPAVPHESDIRVFDPATGSLKVYHVFPDPPGSLVWCIHRDGNWWCCFAWYGHDNARTVLIEYADGGLETERRRFTFPRDVIDDFDGMSASGGIWDGDTILASHHHFPVLYRLRLPDDPAAHELVLVETLDCPFPGQGIAADPATSGGLVGIDRGGRAVVIAEPVTPPCCTASPGSRLRLLLQGKATP